MSLVYRPNRKSNEEENEEFAQTAKEILIISALLILFLHLMNREKKKQLNNRFDI